MWRRLTQLFAAAFLLATTPARAEEITVFAAASLTDACQAIAPAWQKQTGHRAVFNFGASSTLARQIEQGARADIFLSADEAKMDALAAKGLLVPGSRRELLSNTLAIVVHPDSRGSISRPHDLALPEIRRIAVAEPATVPAGIYAREYLEKLGLWSRLAPKIVPCENVRAALAAVDSGNAEVGIVYRTDARMAKRAVLAHEVATADGPQIRYPAAVVAGSRQPAAAASFVEFLRSPEARAVFVAHGFTVLE